MTIDGITYEWFYSGEALFLISDVQDLCFEGMLSQMQMLAECELYDAMAESDARWPVSTRKEFVREFMENEDHLMAYITEPLVWNKGKVTVHA